MNIEKLIGKLASRAKMEAHPDVDVADRVIKALRDKTAARPAQEKPLIWIAALSSATALAMVIVAYNTLQYTANPITAIFLDLPWGVL